jgi:hypothetical protein
MATESLSKVEGKDSRLTHRKNDQSTCDRAAILLATLNLICDHYIYVSDIYCKQIGLYSSPPFRSSLCCGHCDTLVCDREEGRKAE